MLDRLKTERNIVEARVKEFDDVVQQKENFLVHTKQKSKKIKEHKGKSK